jgi:sulfonate transport system permease protein
MATGKLRDKATVTGRWVTRRASGEPRVPAAQAKRRSTIARIAVGALLPVLVLVMWEVSGWAGWIDPRFFGMPSSVADRAISDIASGEIWEQTRITLFRLLVGFAIGSVAGIVVGLVLSQWRVLRWVFEPIIRALYVIPKLALLPLFLLVFGLGELPKIVFVSLGTFYIVAFTTLAAAMLIPTAYHEVSRSYGLSSAQRFRWMILPACLPQIVSSLRIASGISMLLVIAVEFVNADSGLGYYTWHAWQLFLPDRMYVGVVLVSILGVAFSALVGAVGARLVRWSDDEFGAKR